MKYFLLDIQTYNQYVIVYCTLHEERVKDIGYNRWPIRPYLVLDVETHHSLETINKYRCKTHFSLKSAIFHKKAFIELCSSGNKDEKVSICIQK